MKKDFFTLIFLVLFIAISGAQDSLVVQTFTWDSTSRAGTFSFPNDPPESWRKIIMHYNMRCHDAAVGNGNIGCREWDYSCNTFITDPSRKDSTRLKSLSHSVSNFDNAAGNEFRYRENPVYTYHHYDFHDIQYTSTSSETEAAINGPTVQLTLGNNIGLGKNQFLYKASELHAKGLNAGKITGLKLAVVNPADPLDFLKIKLKNTSQASLDVDNPETEGFTEVYFSKTNFPAAGTEFFRFYRDFTWDGTSNIIVEFDFTGSATNNPVQVNAHETAFNGGLISNQVDNALNFNNSGAADISEPALQNVSNEITVGFWAYGDPSSLPRQTSVLEGTDDANRRQINIHLPWENGLVYWDCGNDGGGYDRIEKLSAEADYEGRWTYWTFTKNATTGEMKIYIDGELWHSGTGKIRPIDIQTLYLGKGISIGYYGMMDEFTIWNKELEASTIKEWMFRNIDASHPDFANLVALYHFDENAGLHLKNSITNHEAPIFGSVERVRRRGEHLFKNFEETSTRPHLTFVRGNYSKIEDVTTVIDSLENAPNMVVSYGVDNSELVVLDTQFVWDSDHSFVYDEEGNFIDFLILEPDQTITFSELTYYRFADAKYEILSLVTPYGNGLDLRPEGKTFTIDVSDYAPILRGEKRMSIELGGENQEELDIKFLFIRGTPPREVKDIQNIWPFARGYFDQIQNNTVFEPRDISLADGDNMYKVRASITGHQQNGEFTIRNHFIDLVGARKFDFDVFKECGDIPIYPQGGTWLFDRAGWCPGDPTIVHEFEINDYVTPGGQVKIDYGVNGPLMNEANYLVSAQLVTYGSPSYTLDAEVVEILRPTAQLEHARFNPACNTPMVRIKNNGFTQLTSLKIEYGEKGGNKMTHIWNGELDFLELQDVELPVNSLEFWNYNDDEEGIFEVNISEPNGGSDQDADNNQATAVFERPDVYEFPLELSVRTNSRPNETSYRIRDMNGNILLDRSGFDANTTYTDALLFGKGCYSFELFDSEDDGLYYWYWEQVGPARGRGSARILRVTPQGVRLPVQNFEPEFGRFISYDFIFPVAMGTADPGEIQLLSVYPNPAREQATIQLEGFDNEEFILGLYAADGRRMSEKKIRIAGEKHSEPVSLNGLPSGVYLVKIQNSTQIWERKLVKH